MKTFKDYVGIKEADQMGLPSDGNTAPLDNAEIKELIGMVWDRYGTELKDFIKELADRNSDDDLKDLVKKLNNSGRDMPRFNKDRDKQEIVPFAADRGQGETEEENN
jgi:hypothetical protein